MKKNKPIKPVGDADARIKEASDSIEIMKKQIGLKNAALAMKDILDIIPELDSLKFEDDELHRAILTKDLKTKLCMVEDTLNELSKELSLPE